MKKIAVFVLLMAFGGLVEARISTHAQQHIVQRHAYQSKHGTNTSHFNQSMTMGKLDAIAQKTIKQGSVRPSSHGNGRKTYQYKFKRPVGWGSNGKRANSLRVVTDNRGNVITAFPVN